MIAKSITLMCQAKIKLLPRGVLLILAAWGHIRSNLVSAGLNLCNPSLCRFDLVLQDKHGKKNQVLE